MVSVIITTKNEATNIAPCLTSVKKQSYQNIEVIVVDNGSTDTTKKIVKELGFRVYDKGPERSAQRNFGAQKAKGEYLLFLDADMILTKNVVQEAVDLLRVASDGLRVLNRQKTMSMGQKAKSKKQPLAVVIPERSFGMGFWARCKALERSCYEGVDWMEAARFYQKKVFQEIGGYDETLTGPEDFELPQRLKNIYGEKCIGRISSYILHNEGKLSLIKSLKKKYYYGKKMEEYQKKQSARGYFDKQANICMRYGLFFQKKSIIRDNPIVFLGMLILKTLELSALFIGKATV